MGNVDSIPVISQVKSLVQVMSGDVEGARRTQENFRDTAPVVSQITSMVHAIEGNNDKARETQEKFVKGLDEMTDGLPLVGHIKGAVYYATGDEERGEQTMKSATGSLVSIAGGAAGFVVGGPVGAAAGATLGSQLYDGVVTGVDTAIHGTKKDGSPRYYGSWDTFDRMGRGEASAGEIFDTVGMTVVDAATAALGAKFGGKGKLGGKGSKGIKGIRCKRDAEYHLTPIESEFATSHQRLPGSVSEVLEANWQHLSVPQTVSNLVSLFIILRLIMWNDKNGRGFSRELCSVVQTDNVKACEDALRETLRRMDEHLTSQKEDVNFVLNADMYIPSGNLNNSTITMIRVMSTLYGILESIGGRQQMGVKWLMELCIYEDLGTYRICEEEVLHKFRDLTNKAYQLGEARKERVKRAGKRCGLGAATGVKKPITKTGKVVKPAKTNFNTITSPDVGTHGAVKKINKGKRGKFESNHVPASSTYGKPKPPIDSLPAHSLPYDIHQIAMRKVGTSKSSTVAKTLRGYEADLIKSGKMADAVKIDFVASYGRANAHVNGVATPKTFRPALVQYKNDLHALINEHLNQKRISSTDAKTLHTYLDNQANIWNKNPNMNTWLKNMDTEYTNIVTTNGLKVQPGINVKPGDEQFG